LQGYGFFVYFCFFWLINASFRGVYSNTPKCVRVNEMLSSAFFFWSERVGVSVGLFWLWEFGFSLLSFFYFLFFYFFLYFCFLGFLLVFFTVFCCFGVFPLFSLFLGSLNFRWRCRAVRVLYIQTFSNKNKN